MRSRDERPDGSLPAFAWDDLGFPAPSLSVPLQNSLCFFRLPLPAPLIGFSCELLSQIGRDTGLPCSVYIPRWVRLRLFAEDRLSTREDTGSLSTDPFTFWFKPVSTFGLSELTTFISDSPLLAIPSNLSPSTALVLAVTIPPHGFIALI